MKICAIGNPTAAGGRTGNALRAIHAALESALGPVGLAPTERPMHAAELAREALRDGADLIIAVGGDGTVGEVVNGFFVDGSPVREGARLGIIMRGTGGDIRRTYAIAADLDAQIDVLRQQRIRPIDIGWARFVDHAGEPAERYFCNTLSFGMSGKVCVDVKRGLPARLGGKPGFYLASLRTALTHRNQAMRLVLDNDERITGTFNTVALGNGQYFGGSMRIAPQAVPDDGLFDVVAIGDLTRWEVFSSMSLIYRGAHIKHRKVTTTRTRSLRAECVDESPALLEIDGEGPGRLPLTVELLPRALPLVVA